MESDHLRGTFQAPALPMSYYSNKINFLIGENSHLVLFKRCDLHHTYFGNKMNFHIGGEYKHALITLKR